MEHPKVVENSTGSTTPSTPDHLQHPPPHHQMQLVVSDDINSPRHQNHEPETDPLYHQQIQSPIPRKSSPPPPYAPQIPQQNPNAYPAPSAHQHQQQAVSYPPTNHPAMSTHHQQSYPPPAPTPDYQQQGRPPVLHPHQAGYVPPQPMQFPPTGMAPMNNNNHHHPSQQGYHNNNPQMMYHQYPNGQQHPHHQGMNNGAATTGVPMQQHYQPAYTNGPFGVPNKIGTVGWTTGFFDCMDDPTNAVITCIFPCLTFGQIAEIVDEAHTTCGASGIIYGAVGFFTGCPCIMSCGYRTKMRNKYELVEAPAPDWLSHFFCEPCALCQEFRELRNRGLDPALGWHGNQARIQSMQQQPQVMMTPPMNQNMG